MLKKSEEGVGQRAKGNGQWAMGNGQWAMGNGQWAKVLMVLIFEIRVCNCIIL
ncbi:MAG: hypothetical protein GW885_04245, partial [Cyanobacteria bacterium]|nr:hypothetical protein [Cyanobacteria bacterium CG_2015-22_32_23]